MSGRAHEVTITFDGFHVVRLNGISIFSSERRSAADVFAGRLEYALSLRRSVAPPATVTRAVAGEGGDGS